MENNLEQKIIIEGVQEENTTINQLDVGALKLPADVGRIILGDASTELVARVQKDGTVQLCESQDREIQYDYAGLVEAPYTILTEDGRIFHDAQMRRKKQVWLNSFLDKCEGRYETQSRFLEFYEAIESFRTTGPIDCDLEYLQKRYPRTRCLVEGELENKARGYHICTNSLKLFSDAIRIGLVTIGTTEPIWMKLISSVRDRRIEKCTQEGRIQTLGYVPRDGVKIPHMLVTEDGRLYYNEALDDDTLSERFFRLMSQTGTVMRIAGSYIEACKHR
jgi:hypothetical protein